RVADGRGATFIAEAVDVVAVLALAVGRERADGVQEALLHAFEQDAVLRTLRAGQRRTDVGEVELERGGELGFRRVRVVPEALGFGVGLDKRDLGLFATRQALVVQRLLVDREDAAGGTVFRSHVGDRRAIGERQVRQA